MTKDGSGCHKKDKIGAAEGGCIIYGTQRNQISARDRSSKCVEGMLVPRRYIFVVLTYQLFDVFYHHSNIHLVFDFMETDLEIVTKDRDVVLTAADIKSYMQMLLAGVEHCHKNWILHRVCHRW